MLNGSVRNTLFSLPEGCRKKNFLMEVSLRGGGMAIYKITFFCSFSERITNNYMYICSWNKKWNHKALGGGSALSGRTNMQRGSKSLEFLKI